MSTILTYFLNCANFKLMAKKEKLISIAIIALFLFLPDVFQRARAFNGPAFAVFLTYFFSTMLHGFYPQIGAVLLSLGLYTYAEHSLRAKMASIFDASVAATRPKGESARRAFKYKEGHVPVILVNFAFGILACFNLAYLGVMFNQDQGRAISRQKKSVLLLFSARNFQRLCKRFLGTSQTCFPVRIFSVHKTK